MASARPVRHRTPACGLHEEPRAIGMPTVPTQATRAWSSADARSLRTSSCTIGPSGSPPKGARCTGTLRTSPRADSWHDGSSHSEACTPLKAPKPLNLSGVRPPFSRPVTQALLCASAVCSRADSIELSASQGDDGAAARRRGDLGTHAAVGGGWSGIVPDPA